MKKRIIIILFILIFLSSCNKDSINKINNVKANNSKTKENIINKNNDKIQLWYFKFENYGIYVQAIENIIDNAKKFCEMNAITLEVIGYSSKEISHEDYILKRNLAATSGNMIIIQDARYLMDIAKQHADYTKLDNYNYLISAYKDRFCIPLAIGYRAFCIENDVMNYYGISTEEPLISYLDYLDMKQSMKIKGAKFEQNYQEFYEIVEYYLNMNDLLYTTEESKILSDSDNLKGTLKKSLLEICNDIKLNNDGKLEFFSDNYKKIVGDYHVYDNNSKLTLRGDYEITSSLIVPTAIEEVENNSNKTFIIYPYDTGFSPCFYMHNKITNEKIYDLANFLVSDLSYQLSIRADWPVYLPTFDTNRIKDILNVDKDWQYTEESSERAKVIINNTYNMLIRNDEKSKQIADAYFSNREYSYKIKSMMTEIIYDIAKKLSNSQSDDNLSLEKFDVKDEEINKLIDTKINEFVTNFVMYNN